MGTALVVCIGNELVADDGVGHAVYKALIERELPPGTRLRLLGLGGMDLLEEIDGEDLLVVVDAVQFGAAPGTIHLYNWEQLPFLQTQPVSGHGIGIREAIEVCRRLYPKKLPQHVYLLGIEGKCFNEMGVGLSAEVAAAVNGAVMKIFALLG
jgi:hydrogenase maturation protease